MRYFRKFIEEFKALKQKYPQIDLQIKCIGQNSLWRIHIIGKEMAIIGDAELVTVESYDEEEAYKKAIEKLKDIPKQIAESIEIKSSGRKVGKNNGIS